MVRKGLPVSRRRPVRSASATASWPSASAAKAGRCRGDGDQPLDVRGPLPSGPGRVHQHDADGAAAVAGSRGGRYDRRGGPGRQHRRGGAVGGESPGGHAPSIAGPAPPGQGRTTPIAGSEGSVSGAGGAPAGASWRRPREARARRPRRSPPGHHRRDSPLRRTAAVSSARRPVAAAPPSVERRFGPYSMSATARCAGHRQVGELGVDGVDGRVDDAFREGRVSRRGRDFRLCCRGGPGGRLWSMWRSSLGRMS